MITKYNQTIQSECWLNVFIFVKRIKLTHVSRLKDKRILSSSQTRNIKNITYELATIGVGANIFLNARSGCDGAKSVVQTDDPEYLFIPDNNVFTTIVCGYLIMLILKLVNEMYLLY